MKFTYLLVLVLASSSLSLQAMESKPAPTKAPTEKKVEKKDSKPFSLREKLRSTFHHSHRERTAQVTPTKAPSANSVLPRPPAVTDPLPPTPLAQPAPLTSVLAEPVKPATVPSVAAAIPQVLTSSLRPSKRKDKEPRRKLSDTPPAAPSAQVAAVAPEPMVLSAPPALGAALVVEPKSPNLLPASPNPTQHIPASTSPSSAFRVIVATTQATIMLPADRQPITSRIISELLPEVLTRVLTYIPEDKVLGDPDEIITVHNRLQDANKLLLQREIDVKEISSSAFSNYSKPAIDKLLTAIRQKGESNKDVLVLRASLCLHYLANIERQRTYLEGLNLQSLLKPYDGVASHVNTSAGATALLQSFT